jgi:hypothetical protein
MRNPTRAVARLALLISVGLGLGLSAASSRAAAPPEKTLPSTTLAFIKVNDAAELRTAFQKTQFGRLLADPAMKPLEDTIKDKLQEPSAKLKEHLGVTLGELLRLPTGAVWAAVVTRDDPKLPIAILLSADAGSQNQKAMEEVMTRATAEAEKAGDKVAVTTEQFKGLTLHVIHPKKNDEAANKDEPKIDLAWTHRGSVYFACTDVEALKDVLAHADGRDDSLASNAAFNQVKAKVGEKAPLGWYLDIEQTVRLGKQLAANNGGGNAAQVEAILQMIGVNSLKAVGGSTTLNTGEFDQLSKVTVVAPGPAQGIFRLFPMPKASLKPESWVPATVATYESLSWDLDAAWEAAEMLLGQLPGVQLGDIEKAVGGPDGNFSFQKDLFGPLGDRVTIIADLKKPINEKSQRTLFAIALEDPKAFQNTLGKLLDKLPQKPTKREFQGTTIYDFEGIGMNIPGAPAGDEPKKMSLAIKHSYLFFGTEPTLLEQILRGGAAPLVDSKEYQAVARLMPDKTSFTTFSRPEEQARFLYDMVKGGQLERVLANANRGADKKPDLKELTDKLPDFSVFAKYLTQGGSYAVMDEDGVTLTTFSLRRGSP